MKALSFILLLAILAMISLPSCAVTPEQKQQITSFTELGIQAAVDNGTIKKGDVLFIQSGVAIVSSVAFPLKAPAKVSLQKLGITEALDSGTVSKGDRIIIGEEGATLLNSSLAPPN